MKGVRLLAKGGGLLIGIGFFQPMFPEKVAFGFIKANSMNGFELAEHLGGGSAFCLYAVLIIAVLALFGVVGILNDRDAANDLVFLIPNVIFGIIFYNSTGYGNVSGNAGQYRDVGANMILAGWIVVLVSTIIYMNTRENGTSYQSYSSSSTDYSSSVYSTTMLDRLSGKADGSVQYWTCKKCGCSSNPLSSTTCKDCGAYK